MKRVLFLIHDLGQGGAEKVLVNLVNNMKREEYDITVYSLFDVGENRQYLAPHIQYQYAFKKMFRGNSHIFKLFSPQTLHKRFIKEKYDIEIAYLEGPCARIISGCPNKETKLLSWIHSQQDTSNVKASFRNKKEAEYCYNQLNQIICVSQGVKKHFLNALNIHVPVDVLYNTNETDQIKEKAQESVTDVLFDQNKTKLVGVGKLSKNKGFDRLISIMKRLIDDGLPVHLYILGSGPDENELKKLIALYHLEDDVDLLGYKLNPYKYVAKADLFVCASHAEGFSTAATEALIVGTPVVTTPVAGMEEMLGSNNEYGIITQMNEDSLYKNIKELIENKEKLDHYKKQASIRGLFFSKENTVKAVEEKLSAIVNK